MQFGNKRILAGSSFDIQRAEPSQQQKTKTPALDVRRAESSQQHVRALNTQFARSNYEYHNSKALLLFHYFLLHVLDTIY